LTTQLELLESSRELLPSPKVRRNDRVGIYTWAKLYSAFSESFAIKALDAIRISEEEVVLDPFCGSGTTIVAAAKHGNPVIGIDLDPFSALLSRTAIATNSIEARVEELLTDNRPAREVAFTEEARELFVEADLSYAAGLFSKLQEDLSSKGYDLLRLLLNDPKGTWDSEIVALTALGIAATRSARIMRGSNPVWYRKTVAGESPHQPVPLKLSTKSVAMAMLRDLAELKPLLRRREGYVFNADSRSPILPEHSVDLVLTSPPYLNRLDYVVNHLAPLSLYSAFIDINLEAMRRQMIGTTKIVGKGMQPSLDWGSICLEVLGKIASHPSKASSTYYYWNFHRYFQGLFDWLKEMKRVCKAGARGLVVVQNSYYKSVPVQVPEILVQMSNGLGLSMKIVRREAVRTHLGTISPRQMTHAPKKVLEESVILLEVPGRP
jgi:hypothetical protein